jgi:hypothetical protein
MWTRWSGKLRDYSALLIGPNTLQDDNLGQRLRIWLSARFFPGGLETERWRGGDLSVAPSVRLPGTARGYMR